MLQALLGAVAAAHALFLAVAVAAAGAGLDGDAGQRAVVVASAVMGAGLDVAADLIVGLFRVHCEKPPSLISLELRSSVCP